MYTTPFFNNISISAKLILKLSTPFPPHFIFSINALAAFKADLTTSVS